MLGKIFKKKEDEFFMAIPEGAEAVETPVEFAPTITEKVEGTEAIAAPVEGAVAAPTAPKAPAASGTDNSSIIAAALSAYSVATTSASTEASTFADNYLVKAGNTATRRRPGVNMSEFMGMAKNVKR